MRYCAKGDHNRDERFFGPDARRKDGLSTTCNGCKRKRRQTTNRDQRLSETYGITEADYQAMFEAQGGACAICKGKRKGNLDVDHDHKLGNVRGAVRGLLCRRCNRRLLPSCQDRVDRLEAAIAYLQDPPARRVLD